MAARQATKAGGCMPASYAKRDSGPSIPNSDAETITMTRPRTGTEAATDVRVRESDVKDGLDTGRW